MYSVWSKSQRCRREISRHRKQWQYTIADDLYNPLTPSNTHILGSESHFVCEICARRNIRNEIIQIMMMVIPYPLYLYIIIPGFLETVVFAGFLIETLLVVLSIAGVSSALDLYRIILTGKAQLAEARDRAVIKQRKNTLDKKFNITHDWIARS